MRCARPALLRWPLCAALVGAAVGSLSAQTNSPNCETPAAATGEWAATGDPACRDAVPRSAERRQWKLLNCGSPHADAMALGPALGNGC